jgi:hypothetical protein
LFEDNDIRVFRAVLMDVRAIAKIPWSRLHVISCNKSQKILVRGRAMYILLQVVKRRLETDCALSLVFLLHDIGLADALAGAPSDQLHRVLELRTLRYS